MVRRVWCVGFGYGGWVGCGRIGRMVLVWDGCGVRIVGMRW